MKKTKTLSAAKGSKLNKKAILLYALIIIPIIYVLYTSIVYQTTYNNLVSMRKAFELSTSNVQSKNSTLNFKNEKNCQTPGEGFIRMGNVYCDIIATSTNSINSVDDATNSIARTQKALEQDPAVRNINIKTESIYPDFSVGINALVKGEDGVRQSGYAEFMLDEATSSNCTVGYHVYNELSMAQPMYMLDTTIKCSILAPAYLHSDEW